jgi:general secretion pathway protein E
MRDLGMGERELTCFRACCSLPHGIVLVTGPTGSGKTSTLYTALNEINDAERKIITIEDPIEYQLKGVNQIQVSEKSGLTFARGLRSILRHDPDVMLIGEIRDQETAQIAVQASLTGSPGFLHAAHQRRAGALTRLVDMGVEPYLVASSLEAVLAQRLVRLLCPHCKAPDDSPTARTFKVELGLAAGSTVYRAVGCRECRHTGYHGRRAIFEWMDSSNGDPPADPPNRSTDTFRDAAAARVCARWPRMAGGWSRKVTTIEEVLSVTRHEDESPNALRPTRTTSAGWTP